MKRKLAEGVDYIIRRGRPEDLHSYLQASQRSAQLAYSNPNIDDLDLFSDKHYFHPSIMPYWRAMASNSVNNLWWVAEIIGTTQKVIGGICLSRNDGRLEGRGFYIDPNWQGMGIGRRLWETRRQQVNQPIYFEVYSHAIKTINFHLKNGAVPTGKSRTIHWGSWPKGTYLTALEFVQA